MVQTEPFVTMSVKGCSHGAKICLLQLMEFMGFSVIFTIITVAITKNCSRNRTVGPARHADSMHL